MFTQKSAMKSFLIAAVAMSLVIWKFVFNFTVFHTIFFESVFEVLVISFAIFLGCLWLPKNERPLNGIKLWSLTLPGFWVLVSFASQFIDRESLSWTVFLAGTGVMLIGLPYLLFVVISILQEDAVSLEKRYLTGLLTIALTVATLAYLIGENHYLLMTCEDFRLSGSFVPANCWDITSE